MCHTSPARSGVSAGDLWVYDVKVTIREFTLFCGIKPSVARLSVKEAVNV